MSYRSRLQRIQEKRNMSRAIFMFTLGICIILLLAVYGVKGMAALAIFIDRMKNGSAGAAISDNIPPAPPTIWADYTATNSATLNIYAISEPESVVVLFNNSQEIRREKTDSAGNLNFENVILDRGANQFLAKAEDAAGNSSNNSRSVTIYYFDQKPELLIEKPTEGQKFAKKDNPIEIRGKTVNQARVYVNGRLTIADGSGGFVMKFILNEGENVLKIKAVDSALNETEKEVKVILEL